MRKLYIYTLVVVAVTTIVITALVFAFPDTSGELRTDLAVGDFYELTGDQHVTTYTITEIDGDDYTVHVVQQGKGSRDYTEVMSKDKFLSQIYLRSRDNVPNSADSRMIINTSFGKVLCTLYNDSAMNSYWADGNDVIYRAFVGGVYWTLTETSLFGPPLDTDDKA